MYDGPANRSVRSQSARRMFKSLLNASKNVRLWFAMLIVCWPVSVAQGQCTSVDASARAPQDTPSVLGDFHVDLDEVTVSQVASDHIQFALSFSVQANRDVSVRQISFENMRLNELPFYTPPLEEHLKLIAGQRLPLPRQIQAIFYYRDLESLRPLELLVREGNVRAEGTLYVDLQLNLIDKAVLLARRGRMPFAVQKDLSVEIPGGALARNAGLGVLSLASQTLGKTGAAITSRFSTESSWRQRLWSDYAPALLLADARFSVSDAAGMLYTLDCMGIGFRIGGKQFLLPKEVVEPWKFDPEIATTIQRDGWKLNPLSVDLTVWPSEAMLQTSAGTLDVSTGFQQTQNQFKLLLSPNDELETMFASRATGRPHKIRVHRRESAGNLVSFEFTDSAKHDPLPPIKFHPSGSETSWDRLAVFRFPAGARSKQAHPDLVFLAATRQGSTILLATPIDYSGWGAPLISPVGIVGIVQDERTGIDVEQALRTVRLKLEQNDISQDGKSHRSGVPPKLYGLHLLRHADQNRYALTCLSNLTNELAAISRPPKVLPGACN
jgi:hypothetical protein